MKNEDGQREEEERIPGVGRGSSIGALDTWEIKVAPQKRVKLAPRSILTYLPSVPE